MTPDRLQQIEELFHAARDASSGERAALLDQADPELRREVESLLARQNDPLTLDRSIQLPGDSTMTVLNPGARLGPEGPAGLVTTSLRGRACDAAIAS